MKDDLRTILIDELKGDLDELVGLWNCYYHNYGDMTDPEETSIYFVDEMLAAMTTLYAQGRLDETVENIATKGANFHHEHRFFRFTPNGTIESADDPSAWVNFDDLLYFLLTYKQADDRILDNFCGIADYLRDRTMVYYEDRDEDIGMKKITKKHAIELLSDNYNAIVARLPEYRYDQIRDVLTENYYLYDINLAKKGTAAWRTMVRKKPDFIEFSDGGRFGLDNVTDAYLFRGWLVMRGEYDTFVFALKQTVKEEK